MFCDIHTHTISDINQCLVDISSSTYLLSQTRFVSMGVHPKEGNLQSPLMLLQIRRLASCGQLTAVGECGLDKFSEHTLELQEKILAEQLGIAKEFGLPVIIHCVKLYSEIIRILKYTKFQNPVIFHGYNGNLETTKQLLKLPNAMFSYSMKNTLPGTGGHESLDAIPVDRILTESDCDTQTDFVRLVFTIATIKQIGYYEAADIIRRNFFKIVLR